MALGSPVVGALCLAFWSEILLGRVQGVTSDLPVACGPECPEPVCSLCVPLLLSDGKQKCFSPRDLVRTR